MDGKTIVEVLMRFGIQPQEIVLIQKKLNRQVWRIADGSSQYALKFVAKSSKTERIAAVNNYLHNKGFPVIKVLPTLDGNSFVQKEVGNFLLFPWKEGVRPRYGERGMIERMAVLLAQFHEASRGYVATGGPMTDYRLDWKKVYKRKMERLHNYRKSAESSDDSFSQLFLRHLPWLESRVEWALKRLPHTSLKELILKSRKDPLLGHGDYSHVNLLLDSDGNLVVIDLDTVSMALPMRDISHLISAADYALGSWSAERFQLVLNAYQSVRPLSEKELELLLIDLVFPNKVLRLAKKRYLYGPSGTLLKKLERCLSIDREKLAVLGMGPYQ